MSKKQPKRATSTPSSSSSSSVDVQEELQEERPSNPKKRNRIRISKKEIPEYNWTDEGTRKLAEFVKDHPQLFDKRQRDWLNVPVKSRLWDMAGAQQDPPATGAQCKKHYENMRTRVGKIMKKDQNSGVGQTSRSMREDDIMDMWTFLVQHIRRGTQPSESGTRNKLQEDEDDDYSVENIKSYHESDEEDFEEENIAANSLGRDTCPTRGDANNSYIDAWNWRNGESSWRNGESLAAKDPLSVRGEGYDERCDPHASCSKSRSKMRDSSGAAADEFSIFGELVAHKLRKLAKRPCLIAQNKINTVLFEAEMGNYDFPST